MRDTLFGDRDIWPPETVRDEALATEPWSLFQRANELIAIKDSAGAISTLRKIAETPEMESRIVLQAWHKLRKLGALPPPEKMKQVLGVVIEVGMPKGLDLLSAYPDHCARYYNFSGSAIIWEHPNDSLDVSIDHLLEAGAAVAQRIGPWEKDRPPAPANGIVRMNLLTPSGLHFGQGPFELMMKDPMGGPLLTLATQLMHNLIKIANEAKQTHHD